MTFSRKDGLLAKIYSEGYCCLNGYLRLCKARGEKVRGMAENIEISTDALFHHYRRLEKGKIPCQGFSDCLGPVIKEIENEKKPPEGGL